MAPTNQTKLQVDKTIANLFAPQGASWRTLCHLVRTSYKAPALAEACKAGNTEHLRRLLLLDEGGTALASSTAEHPELSPLMLSIVHSHLACTELLVASGAEVNMQCGPDLETPMHVCCARGNAVVAKVLVNAHADHGACDAHGRSPLLVACMADQPECASLLLAAGANLEQPMAGGNPGATPLYAAAYSGSVSCVSLLCEAGARVNARTVNGASPMLAACQVSIAPTSLSICAARPHLPFAPPCVRVVGGAPRRGDAALLVRRRARPRVPRRAWHDDHAFRGGEAARRRHPHSPHTSRTHQHPSFAPSETHATPPMLLWPQCARRRPPRAARVARGVAPLHRAAPRARAHAAARGRPAARGLLAARQDGAAVHVLVEHGRAGAPPLVENRARGLSYAQAPRRSPRRLVDPE